jgi:hypothetical protein
MIASKATWEYGQSPLEKELDTFKYLCHGVSSNAVPPDGSHRRQIDFFEWADRR